jgi:exosome complex component RRP42
MEEKYALELILKGKRMDGRKFTDFRTIEINKGVIKKAEGSASVKIGDTEVIAGVKLNTGEPFSDTPNEGILIVNSEFTPLASPDFESGPPGEDAVELSRVVDRGIRESHAIDMEKLAIVPGEKVWALFVDIHMINHQGNLLDASSLAAVAAVLNAKIPKIDGENILRGEYEKKLPILHVPITITVGKVGDNFIVDPNFQEEKILDSKLTVAVREDDTICALQKQGVKGLRFEDISQMIRIAKEKSKELRELVQSGD